MIRGQKRALDKRPSVNVNLNASIHNRFDIEVVDAKTGKVKKKAQAENVICNQLWSYMFHSNDAYRAWNGYLHYGTGTGTPSAADTKLFSFKNSIQTSAETVMNLDEDECVFSLREKYVLSESREVGTTITEVGIAQSSSESTLCTHAMLRDMNGNPISILKTDVDILNIYATVFVHWPQTVKNIGFRWAFSKNNAGKITGAPDILRYAVGWGRPYQSTTYLYDYGYVSAETTQTASFSIVDAESRKCKSTFSRIPSTTTSYGTEHSGHGYSKLYGASDFMLNVNPNWFTAPRIVGEAIATGDGLTKDFSTKFRDISSDAVVYVDGTPASVTISEYLPIVNAAYLGRYAYASNLYIKPLYKDTLESAENTGSFSPSNPWKAKPATDDGQIIHENPKPGVIGILNISDPSYTSHRFKLAGSNDGQTWEILGGQTETSSGKYGYTFTESDMPTHKYFWIFCDSYTNSTYSSGDVQLGAVNGNTNIHFDEPPEVGAVITADYTPGVIAKDTDNVFDFSVEFTFGEYTE